MPDSTLLLEATTLLAEFKRRAHSLPLRLRALNMLTYTLDMVFIQSAPALIAEAKRSPDAAAQLQRLAGEAQRLLAESHGVLIEEIMPALAARGICMGSVAECTAEQRAWLDHYFVRTVRALLTPLAVDAGRPFPQISAHSLNLLAVLTQPSGFDVDMPSFARLKVPRKVPRLIHVESAGNADGEAGTGFFILSEDLVRAHVNTLFPGINVTGVYQFRILRGTVDNDGGPVGRHTALARQKAWPVMRIDIEKDVPDWVLLWLQDHMDATDAVVLRREAPLGIGTLALEWAERASLPSRARQ